ncbi:MAG: NosD domain-containing protein [Candidatus Binatia bacterium]
MSIRQERARFPFLRLISTFILLLAQAYGCAQAQTELPEGRFGKLEKNETWSGTVALAGDLLIPSGRTLVVQAGSTVSLTPGKSLWDISISHNLRGAVREITRRGLIDIIVEGTLRMEGQWLSGISVADLEERRPSSWGGLVMVKKGKVEINHASIYLADTAVALFDQSEAKIMNSTFKSNLAAIEAFHQSSLTIKDSTLSANSTGVALYDKAQGRIEDNWLRFNTSALLIADRSQALVSGNLFFKNILAISSLDSTRPQIYGNYLLANQTGIRLGQSTAPEIDGNWSLFETRRVVDERDLQPETVTQ